MARESCARSACLQGLGEERDAAGGLAARDGQPAVHPPEIGQLRGIEPLALFGRSPKRLGRLTDVVLQQPGFGQRAPELESARRAAARAASERADEQGRRLGAVPLLEGFAAPRS